MTQFLGDSWGSDTSENGIDGAYANIFDAIAPGIVAVAEEIQRDAETFADAIWRAKDVLRLTQAQIASIQRQVTRANANLPPIAEEKTNWAPVLILGAVAAAALLGRK